MTVFSTGLLSPARRWPVAIVALLSGNVLVCMLTVRAALGDPSVSYEPRYYERSFDWDRRSEQTRAFVEAGWSLQPEWTPDGGLRVRLLDDANEAATAAGVSVEVVRVLRASERATRSLVQSEPGVWTVTNAADGTGLHELRFTITHERGRVFRAVRILEWTAG